ncbi:hypothetical protein ZHAS_00005323 [Anopheles sinensis]|uniref:Uncharacterized protein n=1 Tax=Anopheles sinensis TaxID=74873 RepID=A0A084VJA3_ANOSI|nr:hypothetical protein ZHAS_00005323 [Anopheles sinensis]
MATIRTALKEGANNTQGDNTEMFTMICEMRKEMQEREKKEQALRDEREREKKQDMEERERERKRAEERIDEMRKEMSQLQQAFQVMYKEREVEKGNEEHQAHKEKEIEQTCEEHRAIQAQSEQLRVVHFPAPGKSERVECTTPPKMPCEVLKLPCEVSELEAFVKGLVEGLKENAMGPPRRTGRMAPTKGTVGFEAPCRSFGRTVTAGDNSSPTGAVTLRHGDRTVNTYALIDFGSSASLMSHETQDLLDVEGLAKPLTLSWTNGDMQEEPDSEEVSVEILDAKGNSLKLDGIRTVSAMNLPKQSYEGTPTLLLGLPHAHLTYGQSN